MIASGELFLLNGETGGELQPLPTFVNQNIRVIAAKFDRAYVAVEPTHPEDGVRRCTVWCFSGDSKAPVLCPEFDVIEETIKQIAIGEKHLMVLTHDGNVYTRAEQAVYGSAGHGGACHAPEFKIVPGLKDKKVKFVSAGPYFSIAITREGDVYSWGQSFNGETGLFTNVDTVPRFAPAVTPFRVVSISCGHSHVLACTEAQQCIAWGENTCGQLGVGQKTKPSFKPTVLEHIPSQVVAVSAGWAHSVAVGSDGKAYTWGLNSHGQLGLGDTKTRLAPNLLHALVGTCQVQTAYAARAMTVFYTSEMKPLLCGMVPCSPNPDAKTVEFAPRRPGETDPVGCLLCPLPLVLTSCPASSELTEIVAFDKGAIGFARSTVYKVAPNLAPVSGQTPVQVFVTGLPYEFPTKAHTQGGQPLIQDLVSVKVRLKSPAPLCDVVATGKIVAENTIEFTTPNVTLSPLGSVVEQGSTSAVALQVSLDNGLTWTVERRPAPKPVELDKTSRGIDDGYIRADKSAPVEGLKKFKDHFHAHRKLAEAVNAAQTVLWYCKWPKDGPTRLEPSCAPVTGGTELVVHVELPPLMPTDSLTVKFVCKPLHSIGDPELEAKAPMRRDGNEVKNACKEELAKLALVGELDVFTCGWLDPLGRGICCITPPFDTDSAKFYDYFVDVSLDGKQFLTRSLPFNVFDLRVKSLEPNIGPLTSNTSVTIKTSGLVQTEIQRVRIDFPRDLDYPSRILPARYDNRTHEITFDMPDLSDEVRQHVEKLTEEAKASAEVAAELAQARAATGLGEPDEAAEEILVDPDGGLSGLEVFVELSINGQHFTEDGVRFTYHGSVQAGAMRMLAPPEGVAVEAAAPAGKPAAKGKPAAVEEPAEEKWHPGAKIGCQLTGALAGTEDSPYCRLRVPLFTRVADGGLEPFKTVELPAIIEMLPAVASGSPAGDDQEQLPPQPTVTAVLDVRIRKEDLPEEAVLLIQNFGASLNGQCFVPCGVDMPLIILVPVATEEGS